MADDQSPFMAFFPFVGAAMSITMTAIGAAYGTAKSGFGISSIAMKKPGLIMKSIVPVVMAGKFSVIHVMSNSIHQENVQNIKC